MKRSKVEKLKPQERFIYWIKEREKLRKGQGSDDEILTTYRFCNVVRRDDRVSRWLRDNWYGPNKHHKNMLVAAVLARHFNLPSTLEHIGFPTVWEPERIAQAIELLMLEGKKVFNSAYVITGKNTGQPNKVRSVVFTVCDTIYEDRMSALHPKNDIWDTVEGSVQTLCEYPNIGTFMAGQIVADLVWYRNTLGFSFKDRHTWAPIGPGSRRGMNRYQGRPTKAALSQKDFVPELKQLIKEIKPKLPLYLQRKMLAIDYQNCLCEFDKYNRVLTGEGTPKRKYVPHKEK